MNWKIPVRGDRRVKRKFLIFPATLPNVDKTHRITRWLEMAEIAEVYEGIGKVNHKGEVICMWQPVRWFDI